MRGFLSNFYVVALCCLVFSSVVFAGDSFLKMPRGFEDKFFLTTVSAVQSKGRDKDYVKISGRLTNFLGDDHYEFVDLAGNSIEVELDDDINWSNVHKDQLIEIYGKIDRNMFFIVIEAKDYRPLETPQSNATVSASSN